MKKSALWRDLDGAKLIPALLCAVPWLAAGLMALRLAARPILDFEAIRDAYNDLTIRLPILFGVVSACLCLSGGFARQRWLRIAASAYGAIALACVALRIHATHIEPKLLAVREAELASPKIGRPIRLLHISDIQSDAVGRYEERVFDRMRALNPDLIVQTGDLLQPVPPATAESELPKMERLFETLHPPLGVWGVYGICPRLEDNTLGGMRILENDGAEIRAGESCIRIFGLGLDRSQALFADSAVERWLSQPAESAFRLLIGHAPDFALWAREREIDLCLAGHTHGGQVRLPFFGPIVTLSQAPREWARGFRRIGTPWLNVSAGIGVERAAGLPPIRFFCRPEMTLIRLVPSK
ncbi:MAG: putative metallophosphoesterase [candidate division BRC1 bacterium ADurb.BinA364]|nr:MAG: putative metallophosphoesterase [candidate division BRC1 bacterium ADurb.BinA364]